MSNLTILSRSRWDAKPPTSPRTLRKPYTIRELFIHWPGEDPRSWHDIHTQNQEATVLRSFQHYHQVDNGWADIGYNHVMGNGGFKEVPRIWTGRGAQYIPAAQLGHNPGTIAICVLVGPNDPITENIVSRLRSYIRWAEGYSGNKLRVRGHGEVYGTECPGPRLRGIIRSGRLRV